MMTTKNPKPKTQNSEIVIYTDGSSRGNPGPGGWGVVVIDGDFVREMGGRDDMTTNNRMELLAAIEGLSHTKGAVRLLSDSSYLLQGMRSWIEGWKKNGWKTANKKDVENRDLWERLDKLRTGRDVVWEKVGGHSGVAGNERCDEIATAFADDISPRLYSGTISSYPIDLSKTVATAVNKKSKGRAFSYLSLVDGVFSRHASWAECEKQVSGKKGARFKKAMSPEDERHIMRDWGIDS